MDLRKLTYSFLGGIYIPKEILEKKEEKLLHISDTPSYIFPKISTLIDKVKPEYIVHTGDMVDDLKLQIYPTLIDKYEENVEKLIKIIEKSTTKKSILTLGNHDNKDIVEKMVLKSIVVEGHCSLDILGTSFKMGHYAKDILKNSAQYNLFGHDLSVETGEIDKRVFLNGISNIHIIILRALEVYYLDYPWGTDDLRLCKRRFNI